MASTPPRILVGPIVRNVSEHKVSIFIVTQTNHNAWMELYDTNSIYASVYAQSTSSNGVKIGKRLYAHLLTIELDPALYLTDNKPYYYNIFFSDYQSLINNEILAGGINEYLYEGDQLPNFLVPPREINDLHIIHASCRKPHGSFKDAFKQVDSLINQAFISPETNPRPHILCLTGDQIYADDVADSLLHIIRKFNDDYIDIIEDTDNSIIDLTRIGNGSTTFSIQNNLSCGNRGSLIAIGKENSRLGAGFSVEASSAKSHLVKLGEFIGMYVMIWSDAAWPHYTGGSLPSYENVFGVAPDSKSQKYATFNQELSDLESFHNDIKYVKRALANTQVLMIFDDHEITDDLFFNKEWVDKVYQCPLGVQIIQNGLTAYSIFQDWGNTPEEYAPDTYGRTILNAFSDTGGSVSVNFSLLNSLLIPNKNTGDTSWTSLVNTGKTWNYIYQPFISNNKYEIIALDCRTNRQYTDGEYPALISDASIASQVPAQNNGTLELSIFMIPSPLWDVQSIEDKKKSIPILSYKLDKEGWGFERYSREKLACRFLNRKYNDPSNTAPKYHRVVLLTGDVHYGFAKRAQFWGQLYSVDGPTSAMLNSNLVIANMCASSFKNETAYASETFKIEGTIGQTNVAMDNVIKQRSTFNGLTNKLKIQLAGQATYNYQSSVKGVKRNGRILTYQGPNANLDLVKMHRKYEQSHANYVIGFNNVGELHFQAWGDTENSRVIQNLYWARMTKASSGEAFEKATYEVPMGFNLTEYQY